MKRVLQRFTTNDGSDRLFVALKIFSLRKLSVLDLRLISKYKILKFSIEKKEAKKIVIVSINCCFRNILYQRIICPCAYYICM